MNEADTAIHALHAKWADAIRRGDVAAALELLTNDYVLWAPSSPALKGRDGVMPAASRNPGQPRDNP